MKTEKWKGYEWDGGGEAESCVNNWEWFSENDKWNFGKMKIERRQVGMNRQMNWHGRLHKGRTRTLILKTC